MKTKRILSLLLAVVLVVGLVLTLASCSKYGALQSAFEKEGYTVNEDFDAQCKRIQEELEKEEYVVNCHMLTKDNGISSVLIVEFKSTEELRNAYKDSETLQGAVKDIANDEDVQKIYNELKEAGYVNGNCFVVPLSVLYYKDILKIVKNA